MVGEANNITGPFGFNLFAVDHESLKCQLRRSQLMSATGNDRMRMFAGQSQND
jgi:hypothetical protein